MTAADVASAMRMALRTYERFEAGGSRLNIDYVHRFANATDSDPYAIILAVAIGSPELARRCADNKLVTTLVIGARRFDQAMGDRIHQLEARSVILSVCAMFDELATHSDEQQQADQWLKRGVSDLSSVRPKPGR
ncbi:MAG: XRE family transcriptional regulator [Brevundimonas sp.]|nr:XRE family transcriptional regulator [Brevundimonas sp.]MDP3406304.1 XRE family transcriptional regulator [Brevundimonas sp.]